MIVDERDLLEQIKQSEGAARAAAFAELVRRHQTPVFNVAYRLLGRRRDAEDAAQEAFLRAYGAIDRFDVERPFAPWIKRITTNLCLNILQSSQRKTQIEADDMRRPAGAPAGMDRWATAVPTPEQAVVRQEQGKRLRQSILSLPPRYRAVIELRHFQEMTYEEIAETLERPLSSVKSDLFRARKMLAAMMR